MLLPRNGCQFVFNSSLLKSSSYPSRCSPRVPPSVSIDAVVPLHKETDPAAQDLQLPPRWSPVLLVLLSGVPRIALSPPSDKPSTGRAADHDSVRCRGPIGAGQLAAPHTIRQTFVLAVVRNQIKVFGRDCSLWKSIRRGGSTQSKPNFEAFSKRHREIG